MQDAKPLWASKTFWAQVIALVALIATNMGLDLGLDEAAQATLVGGIMVVVNVILRAVTTRPVTVAPRQAGRIKAPAGAVAAAIGLALALGACASNAPPEVQWAQKQTVYNDTLATLIALRKPCQPGAEYPNGGPDHPLCGVSDEMAAKIEPLRAEADRALRRAQAAADAGRPTKARDYLTSFTRAFERLLILEAKAQAAADRANPEG